MKLYSQNSVAYQGLLLPHSNLTLRADGCLLFAIAMLGQVDPISLMNTPGGFAQGGLLYPAILAKAAGMSYVGPTSTPPKGWCIGRTAYYTAQGFPTHFLLVNWDTQEMVNPLHKPETIKVEPLTYPINQFRVFDGIKFTTETPTQPYEAPGEPPIPDWGIPDVDLMKKASITTPPTQTIGNMTAYQLTEFITKLHSVLP
jgi:hypothetical protein